MVITPVAVNSGEYGSNNKYTINPMSCTIIRFETWYCGMCPT